ncbi:hypothetical protein H2198_004476 [Neophaeococcomyces mojaviensis]|uniref:Uncharacterized protein n=1 Tax=Neophaeococcomyces mojaviensis TaxID=3383035 RepID=A0ACC3A8K4_9EURO|nr:hypothetical protein H2198_004476 [Knufia sp. JES_112]
MSPILVKKISFSFLLVAGTFICSIGGVIHGHQNNLPANITIVSSQQSPWISSLCQVSTVPTDMCHNVTAQPSQANYTISYSCSMIRNYAFLDLYYNECQLINTTTSLTLVSPVPTAKPALYSPSEPTTLVTKLAGADLASNMSAAPPPPSLNTTRPTPLSLSTNPTSTIPTLSVAPTTDTYACCDPDFGEPNTFEMLCFAGNGTNIGVDPSASPVPPGAQQQGWAEAKCIVSPIIDPPARCKQVGFENGEWSPLD